MPTRYYSNTAVRTTLSAGVTNIQTTLSVQSVSGYPTSYPYIITIDRSVSGKAEACLVVSASGTTLTVVRGYDGTTAVAHDPGAEVSHDHTAIDYSETQARLDILEGDRVNVAAHGAVGDAVGVRGNATAGSTTVTVLQGVFNAGHVGKTVIIADAVAVGVPLVTTISAVTNGTTITLATPVTLAVTAPSDPDNTNVVFGTNSTTAFIAARNAVYAAAVALPDIGTGKRCTKSLFIPPGRYIVTSADAILSSPTGGTSENLWGYTVEGEIAASTIIYFATSQVATTDQRLGNLLLAANRLRGARFRRFSVRSMNANQSFMYAYCSAYNAGTPRYPEYGFGAQSDMVFDDLRLFGVWKRVFGFDGDAAANLNSEIRWTHCQFSGTFSDAGIRIGFIEGASYPAQQDQFLNYALTDCNVEYDNGDFLVADKGGAISVRGGSWINGIGSTTGGGAFFKMGPNIGHFDSVQQLNVIGTRFELRGTLSKLLDTGWGGPDATIFFANIQFSTNVIAGINNQAVIVFRNNSSGNQFLPRTSFHSCSLPGYILVDYPNATTLAWTTYLAFYDCLFRGYQAGSGTTSTGQLGPVTVASGIQTFLRTTGATVRYSLSNCYNLNNTRN